MRRSLAVFLSVLLLACGGEEKPPPSDAGAGDGGSHGEIQTLNVPPPGEAAKPVPPPAPVDPQAAMFTEADRLIQSSDVDDRAQAIIVLRDAKDQTRAGRYVARLLFDRDEDVRTVAAEAIGSFDYPPGADNLRTLLTNEDSAVVRKAALQSLYALAKEAALDDCVKLLKDDDDSNVRAAAAGILGRIGKVEAVEPLVAAVKNEFDDTVLLQALTALGQIGSAKALDVTIEALQFSGATVRAGAARALGAYGDKQAVGPLLDALTADEESQVIVAAIGSLAKLTGVATKEMQITEESTVAEQDAAVAAWKAWRKSNE